MNDENKKIDKKLFSHEKLIEHGYIIDTHCYPNVAYKGARFDPDDIFTVFTEKEYLLFHACKDAKAWFEEIPIEIREAAEEEIEWDFPIHDIEIAINAAKEI